MLPPNLGSLFAAVKSLRGMRELVQDPDGSLSTADTLLYTLMGTVFALWFTAGALQLAGVIQFADYEPWLDWGKNFLFASLVPYVIKRMTNKEA